MDASTTVAKAQSPAPCTIVVFGASGDLARRKLLPALYNLDIGGKQMLAENTAIIGFARRLMAAQEFRDKARADAVRFAHLNIDDQNWDKFAARLDYLGGLDDPEGFNRLRERLEELESLRGLPPNRIYYLSVPPGAIIECARRLHETGLISSPSQNNFTRLVVEKPIGHDLKSALEIDSALHRYFAESQIYRIDHYLGKETVQNLLVLRFANSIFERIWGNQHVDHVQIAVAEAEGVGTRAGYYDSAGALRDMVQNHMLQLLSLIAMEPPVSLDASSVYHAKLDVLHALRPLTRELIASSVVRGRYAAGAVDAQAVRGYLEEEGVAAGSVTETYVALKVYIDNWRWSGVPFYLRTGKRMPCKATSIFVQFKEVPQILFNRERHLAPNSLSLRIQPDEGFAFDVMAKRPGLDLAVTPVRMNLRYASEFNSGSPDAYERLLLDVMAGDHTLFIGEEFVEKSWRFVQEILDAWREARAVPIAEYPAGTWGPVAADRIIWEDHRSWREP